MQDLPLISFCVPVYHDEDSVEAAVESIMDQDYPNIEVILSVDGCDASAKAVRRIITRYKGDKRRVEAIYAEKNRGACIARNEAANIAKGKYLSFLPADAKIFPGVVRHWVEILEDHPEYDFLYGGYRFVDRLSTEKEVKEMAEEYKQDPELFKRNFRKVGDKYVTINGFDYMSEPFDPYILESHNYIDGSFPMRKKAFERVTGWDPAIKSLQDYDLWLGIVKSGGKGLYVQDIFFETSFPHKGGLSDDSSKHWIERMTQIKNKHNIPIRKICVTSLGAAFHGKRMARILDADFLEMPSFKPNEYEMIYEIGFFPSMGDLCAQVFHNCKGKKVIHWIGSDIWQLQQMDYAHRQILLSYFKGNIDEHLCEADFTQKELKDLGIEAKVVPIPPRFFFEQTPLPEKFTVAVYQPEVNANFYLPGLCEEIAKLCPEMTFKFFGNNSRVGKINNIEYVGYVNKMDEFIKDCSAIMRLTVHDGLPISVLEFVSAGRHAVVNVPVKHTVQVETKHAGLIANKLKQLKNKPLNKEGAKYWRRVLSHATYKKNIEGIMGYNPDEYWEKRAEAWSIQADHGYSLTKEEKKLLDKWLSNMEFKSVLDIGCGNGRFVNQFDNK
jgi:glycosyltransferase involved in cell wall biosynthesis